MTHNSVSAFAQVFFASDFDKKLSALTKAFCTPTLTDCVCETHLYAEAKKLYAQALIPEKPLRDHSKEYLSMLVQTGRNNQKLANKDTSLELCDVLKIALFATEIKTFEQSARGMDFTESQIQAMKTQLEEKFDIPRLTSTLHKRAQVGTIGLPVENPFGYSGSPPPYIIEHYTSYLVQRIADDWDIKLQ